MTLSTDDIQQLRTAVQSEGQMPQVEDGTDADGNTVYRTRANLVGAVNQLERIANDLNEYGITVANLPAEKAARFENAHADFQYWVAELSSALPENIAGFDESIELGDGSVVDLPLAAMTGSGTTVELPDKPQ